jgi:hypothetical protein
MRLDTRYLYLLLILVSLIAMGCGGGGNGSTNPPPVDHPPTVTITSGPANNSTINPGDNAVYTWQGTDEDGNLKCYYAGLDGSLDSTVATTMTFNGFTPGSSHTFSVYAVDLTALHSTTQNRAFNVAQLPQPVVMGIAGQGLVDADNDLMWTQYRINWSPVVDLNGQTLGLRLLVGVRPSAGGPETLDSTELINRSPGEDDTLYFNLPTFTRNYYDMRAELHKADGTTLINIPYDSITSLRDQGLEDIDGFIAWIQTVDTSNSVDTLTPFGFLESLDIWVDVDEYGDPADIRLVLFERTSAEELAGQEHVMSPDLFRIIQGVGPQDQIGWHLTALSAPDVYDYRLELHDHFTNQLLAQVNYGNPTLTNIPLGINIAGQRQNRIECISK